MNRCSNNHTIFLHIVTSRHFLRLEYNQEVNGGIPRPIKERKKHDRFNGMPEEEVSKRTLPDHLTENLDIIIVSILHHLNSITK